MNYGNRNMSSTYTTTDLFRGYSGAVFVSCGIAYISRTLLAKQLSALKGGKLILASAALNYFAGAFAGASNCILMRLKEMEEGVNIQDESGENTYGKSKVCGK